MCGIIAYNGPKCAAEVVLKGLKKLEYRGYDSWGILTLQNSHFCINKKIGKIGSVALKDLRQVDRNATSTIGIGHTRWATHGGVTQLNAHPHLSNSGRFAVVHNGIVENFEELTSQLKFKGYKFKSETDTEVIANLIEEEMKKCQMSNAKCQIKSKCQMPKMFKQEVRDAFKKLEGRNAIVVLDKETGEMLALRQGSPLLVGIGQNEYFIASDITAFLAYTDQVMYLDDGQMVVINVKCQISNVKSMSKSKCPMPQISFYDIASGKEIKRRIIKVDLKPEAAEMGKYKHFMIKEIMEQKETIKRAVSQDDIRINYVANLIKKSRGAFFIAAGTAGRVCHFGEYIFAKIAHRHINFVVASEFKNYLHFITPQSLVIVVSQSGETADDLEPMEEIKKIGAKIVSIVNVAGSSIDRWSDYTFLIKAGPEQAVASTKATTAQMVVVSLLAYALADRLKQGKHNLIGLAGAINELLNPRYEERIKQLARKIQKTNDIMIIGKGVNYPAALEAEIKLQETSYIHAQGFAGGELKHYALSLIHKGVPAIIMAADDNLRQELYSNAKEIKSRGGYIIGIDPANSDIYDFWLRVPNVAPELSAIVNLIPVQILAYHLAILRGVDPDKPRNLAKSVTVK
ncbi:MAG: glutamine--fructose-6-phosphate transaminase (isomerizing) [Patescibacteria group bacterium]